MRRRNRKEEERWDLREDRVGGLVCLCVCMWQLGGVREGGGGWSVYVTHTIRQDEEKANEVHGNSPCILHYANKHSNAAAAARWVHVEKV